MSKYKPRRLTNKLTPAEYQAYMMRELTGASKLAIAKAMGVAHSTVTYYIEQAEKKILRSCDERREHAEGSNPDGSSNGSGSGAGVDSK